MIQDTIKHLEAKLNKESSLNENSRTQLVALLNELKEDINELSESKKEDAQSIANYANISTVEATRDVINQELLKHSIVGFKSSIQSFENSHPKLVESVNRVATILSTMGI